MFDPEIIQGRNIDMTEKGSGPTLVYLIFVSNKCLDALMVLVDRTGEHWGTPWLLSRLLCSTLQNEG